MTNRPINLTLRIAPKTDCGYWTVNDWEIARKNNDWNQMIQIFSDRICFRFIDVVNGIVESDLRLPNRRYGFSIMALDCLLVETLHQFYSGKKESPRGGGSIRLNGRRATQINELGQNGQFYASFFTASSFKFKPFFENKEIAAVLFYQDIRCGLLHAGETGGSSVIRVHYANDKRNDLFTITQNNTGLVVYRDTFHETLCEEVREYKIRLKGSDHIELRNNFIKKMGYVCGTDYGDGNIQ